MTDNHLPNKTFIVDSITTDYRLGKQEIRLIEKSNMQFIRTNINKTYRNGET